MDNYKIRRILVPIDLSQTSLNALETAVDLSIKFGATLHILNVDEKISRHPGEINVPFKTYPDTFTALTGAIRHIRAINLQFLKKEGHVAESILDTAIDEKIDLVILGTHGASGPRDGFIGSTCYMVMKHAGCHILTIPGMRKFNLFNSVLFPIRPVIGALVPYRLVRHFLSNNPTLNVLGLSSSPVDRETNVLKKLTEELKPEMESGLVKVLTFWGKGVSVSADVLHFVQIHNPDLIILTSFLDGILKPNYIGPHTQRIIHSSRVPLLYVK